MKTDGRSVVQKGNKGYLVLLHPDKTFAEILEAQFEAYGTLAAVARALGVDRQTVRDWVNTERDAGRLQVIEQPPRIYKAVR